MATYEFTASSDETLPLDVYDLNDAHELAEWCLSDGGDGLLCETCGSELETEPLSRSVLVVECPDRHDVRRVVKRHAWPETSVSIVTRDPIRVGKMVLASAAPAIRALVRVDAGRSVFRRDDELVTVTADGFVRPLSARMLRHRLVPVAWWVDERRNEVEPSLALAQAIIDSGDFGEVPPLRRVARAPFFRPDGSLVAEPGYDRETGTYYVPDDALRRLDVSEEPTWRDVAEAKTLLLEELIGDFPFVDETDRANALSVLLTPFVRDLIFGPTPLHWIHAPEPGTGKTMLVNALTIPACGVLASQALPEIETERRKTLVTVLREGAPAVKFDNVKGEVRSASLEAVLTETVVTGRLLGGNSSVGELANRAVWTLTANNARPGTDLKRRTVLVRLDAKVAEPAKRRGPRDGKTWRHLLPAWAIQNRADLARAALVLCRWWVAQGMPHAPSGRMGSFESWESIIGGILESAGISGFLGNLEERDAEDDEKEEIGDLLAAWREHYGDRELTAREVVEDGALREHVGPHMGHKWDARSVGAYLRERRDRIARGYRLVKVPRRSAADAWRVEQA